LFFSGSWVSPPPPLLMSAAKPHRMGMGLVAH
jgi:hypothetical protein